MDGPADVVVVVRARPVRVPAVAPVPGIDGVQVAVDLVLAVRGAHRLQERVDDHLEEEPVVVPEALAVDAGQPRGDPRPRAPGPGGPRSTARLRARPRAIWAASTIGWETSRMRGQASRLVGSVPDARPRAYRPARSPGASPLDPARRAAASRKVRAKPSRPSLRRRREMPRESGTKISAWVRLGVSAHSFQKDVGDPLPVHPRPPGEGRSLAVFRGKVAEPAIGHDILRAILHTPRRCGEPAPQAPARFRVLQPNDGGEQQNAEGGGCRAGLRRVAAH